MYCRHDTKLEGFILLLLLVKCKIDPVAANYESKCLRAVITACPGLCASEHCPRTEYLWIPPYRLLGAWRALPADSHAMLCRVLRYLMGEHTNEQTTN